MSVDNKHMKETFKGIRIFMEQDKSDFGTGKQNQLSSYGCTKYDKLNGWYSIDMLDIVGF